MYPANEHTESWCLLRPSRRLSTNGTGGPLGTSVAGGANGWRQGPLVVHGGRSGVLGGRGGGDVLRGGPLRRPGASVLVHLRCHPAAAADAAPQFDRPGPRAV